MAVSRYVLKTLDGIDRPAIATVMPNQRDGYTTVLDLGANVDCTRRAPAAVRGDGQRAGRGGRRQGRTRRVGLLNIGEEAIKGSETIKQAGELLRAAAAGGHAQLPRQRRRQRHLQGHDRHRRLRRLRRQRRAEDRRRAGRRCSSSFIKQEFTRNALHQAGRAGGAAGAEPLQDARRPRRYNGAALLGLRGLVFKSHGSADAFAFEQALNRAYDAARNGLLDRVHDRIRETLAAMPARAERRRASADPTPALSRMTTTLPRYSRITGTGSYLPPRARDATPTSRRSWRSDGIETSDAVDRRAHRHPRAPFRRARRARAATSRVQARAARARSRRLRCRRRST